MKTNISIMTWINRVLMIPFLILLLIGIVEKEESRSLAFILAFFIGIYQVFSFLMTLFYLEGIDKKKKILVFLYFIITALYFITIYLFLDGELGLIMDYFVYTMPIFLSLFWTYILESLKQKV